MGLRVGIFSDDAGSSHAAAMVGQGLSEIGRAVTVVAQEFRPGGDLQRVPMDAVSVVALPDRVNAFEMQSLLRRSEGRDEDCVMSLPLAAMREQAIRIQFDVAIAVGRDRPAAERALKAARYDAVGPGTSDAPPVWFLACAGQNDLRTKADLRPERGPLLPFAVRSLPATLPRLAVARWTALMEGRATVDEVRAGILLAALVVAIAADPHAKRVDAGILGHLMATRDLTRERDTSDLLIGLAAAYERIEDGGVDSAGPQWACGTRAAPRGSMTRRRAAVVGRHPATEGMPGRADNTRRTR